MRMRHFLGLGPALLGALGAWGLTTTAAWAAGGDLSTPAPSDGWLAVPTSIGAVCLWLVVQLKRAQDDTAAAQVKAVGDLAAAREASDKLRLAEAAEYASRLADIYRGNKDDLLRVLAEQREMGLQLRAQQDAQFERVMTIMVGKLKRGEG